MAHNNRPMRRSALIGPWGVGAIVPFPNDESLMIAGLDMWRYNDATPFVIKDERLLRRLGVQELRWPPDFRENNADPQNCFLKERDTEQRQGSQNSITCLNLWQCSKRLRILRQRIC